MLDGVVEVIERRRTAPMADRGMIVAVVSWIFLVATVLIVMARFATKLALSKKGKRFGLDDLFVALAFLFSIGQTAAVSMEAMQSLGQRIATLDDYQKSTFFKAEYAGCILYIANMGCARISVCLLIKKILPGPTSKWTASVFAIFSAVWTVSGMFVTAFPCAPPEPWVFKPGKCFDLTKFINYVGTTNILIEVALVSVPLFVWNLRTTAGKRISVSLCFLSRLLIVAAVAAQLAFFNRYLRSDDLTFNYWRTVLCIQIAQNLSVITACIPALHPFILSILSGATQTDSLRFDPSPAKVKDFFKQTPLRPRNFKYNSTSSYSSTSPIQSEKDSDYCRPLATYGLDRSSAHLNSQHFNRFPCNVATPIKGPDPPENVFNRSVEIPRSASRPPTAHSNKDPLTFPAAKPVRSKSQKSLPPIPRTLSQVGVLPMIDWDSSQDGSVQGDSGGRGSPERKRTSEYVFNRGKVISVPEDNAMYEQEYWRRYPPPPLSGEK